VRASGYEVQEPFIDLDSYHHDTTDQPQSFPPIQKASEALDISAEMTVGGGIGSGILGVDHLESKEEEEEEEEASRGASVVEERAGQESTTTRPGLASLLAMDFAEVEELQVEPMNSSAAIEEQSEGQHRGTEPEMASEPTQPMAEEEEVPGAREEEEEESSVWTAASLPEAGPMVQNDVSVSTITTESQQEEVLVEESNESKVEAEMALLDQEEETGVRAAESSPPPPPPEAVNSLTIPSPVPIETYQEEMMQFEPGMSPAVEQQDDEDVWSSSAISQPEPEATMTSIPSPIPVEDETDDLWTQSAPETTIGTLEQDVMPVVSPCPTAPEATIAVMSSVVPVESQQEGQDQEEEDIWPQAGQEPESTVSTFTHDTEEEQVPEEASPAVDDFGTSTAAHPMNEQQEYTLTEMSSAQMASSPVLLHESQEVSAATTTLGGDDANDDDDDEEEDDDFGDFAEAGPVSEPPAPPDDQGNGEDSYEGFEHKASEATPVASRPVTLATEAERGGAGDDDFDDFGDFSQADFATAPSAPLESTVPAAAASAFVTAPLQGSTSVPAFADDDDFGNFDHADFGEGGISAPETTPSAIIMDEDFAAVSR